MIEIKKNISNDSFCRVKYQRIRTISGYFFILVIANFNQIPNKKLETYDVKEEAIFIYVHNNFIRSM